MTAAALAAFLAAAAAAQPVGYDQGMAARRAGDSAGAQAAFEAMLAKDPSSGGALEGLALTALDQGRYEDAARRLEQWKAAGDNAYIESLLARAYGKLGRENERVAALLAQGRLDETDLTPLRRADSSLRDRFPGVFPQARAYKSLSQEGLETGNPQRVVYEGRSASAAGRAAVGRGVSAIAGAGVRQEAQRNDTGGFTYYDILEQTYSLGLEGRARRASWSASYGQSVLSDNKALGVGRIQFSRVKASGEAELGPLTVRAAAERAPYFLRGAGGNRYFGVLREASAKVEAEAYRFGLGWLARGAVYDYSENTTMRSSGLSATRELSSGLMRASYANSYQEFYGAGLDGRLNYVVLDRFSASWRWSDDERWEASAGAGEAFYRDGNRRAELDGSLRLWLPFWRELSARWRTEAFDYRMPRPGYRSSDYTEHWIGPVWRRRWARGLLSELAYEHGFLRDARGAYEGSVGRLELEWHASRAFAFQAEGRLASTTLRDESFSGGLRARWSF